MTDSNLFFRLIWRLNGLVVLAIGLLALTAIMPDAVRVMSRVFSETGAGVTNDSETGPLIADGQPFENKITKLVIGPFKHVADTLYLAETSRGVPGGKLMKSYDEYSDQPVVNLIALDATTAKVRRLFAGDNGLVAGQYDLWSAVMSVDKPKKAGIIVRYIKSDTDGDKRLTDIDRGDLVLIDAKNGATTTLASDAGVVTSYPGSEIGAGVQRLFFKRGEQQFMLEIDSATMTAKPAVELVLPPS